MDIADSRLMTVRGQLRFLSRYFLKPDESLVHGAEIFADFLNDQNFVDEVEKADREREVFTFEVVEEAVLARFEEEAMEIMEGYVRLLVFDALVGNNDHHFYNWGVITDVRGKRPARFSPVYDTARGLFWNDPDQKLKKVVEDNRVEAFVAKYTKGSRPKTGWTGSPLNHFDFIAQIESSRSGYRHALRSLDLGSLEEKTQALLQDEFEGLFIPERALLILECLRVRRERLESILGN